MVKMQGQEVPAIRGALFHLSKKFAKINLDKFENFHGSRRDSPQCSLTLRAVGVL